MSSSSIGLVRFSINYFQATDKFFPLCDYLVQGAQAVSKTALESLPMKNLKGFTSLINASVIPLGYLFEDVSALISLCRTRDSSVSNIKIIKLASDCLLDLSDVLLFICSKIVSVSGPLLAKIEYLGLAMIILGYGKRTFSTCHKISQNENNPSNSRKKILSYRLIKNVALLSFAAIGCTSTVYFSQLQPFLLPASFISKWLMNYYKNNV